MSSESDTPQALKTGVDFASELIVPGGSNLVEGNFVQGGIHAVLGLVARSIFGLPGLIAVSANSFTKATTGRHIHEHLGLGIGQEKKEQASQRDATHVKDDRSRSAYSLPQGAAKRRQPSSKKRTSSSKTNKEN